MKERLQKILARAGHGSRRAAEALIVAGRVTVNDKVVQLGSQADPDIDDIRLDGAPVLSGQRLVYLAMNKPAGFVTTAHDPHGRPTVMGLLPPGLPPHVLPVGRLDQGTEGLLLFTNDGEFAHRLAHPSFEVEKEYHVLVTGTPSPMALKRLREGVEIGGRPTSPAAVVLSPPPTGYPERIGHTWLRITIHEGRKRQVRLMTAAIGHQTRTLVRTRIGPVGLEDLARMRTRPLSSGELRGLQTMLALQAP